VRQFCLGAQRHQRRSRMASPVLARRQCRVCVEGSARQEARMSSPLRPPALRQRRAAAGCTCGVEAPEIQAIGCTGAACTAEQTPGLSQQQRHSHAPQQRPSPLEHLPSPSDSARMRTAAHARFRVPHDSQRRAKSPQNVQPPLQTIIHQIPSHVQPWSDCYRTSKAALTAASEAHM